MFDRLSYLSDLTSKTDEVKARIVAAVWTLDRLQHPDSRWLGSSVTSWPDHIRDYAGNGDPLKRYENDPPRIRPSGYEIDEMQPALDLMQLLPQIDDRHLVHYGSLYQYGQVAPRIPWGKVRTSLEKEKPKNRYIRLERTTLWRHYNSSAEFIARCLINDKMKDIDL